MTVHMNFKRGVVAIHFYGLCGASGRGRKWRIHAICSIFREVFVKHLKAPVGAIVRGASQRIEPRTHTAASAKVFLALSTAR